MCSELRHSPVSESVDPAEGLLMSKVTYIESGGEQHVVDVQPGLSLMEGAVQNGVPGIPAICGGACACATCHIYIDEAWRSRIRWQYRARC